MNGNEAFSRVLIDAQLREAGWNLTDGRSARFEYILPDGTKADYLLSDRDGRGIAVVEAKDNNHPVGGGMQQALAYAEALDVPFVFSSNGDAFSFHDRTGLSHPVECSLSLHEFPTPDALWSRYRAWKGLADDAEKLVRFPYHDDGSGKGPRYYQRIAIQRTIEAIADHGARFVGCNVMYLQDGTRSHFMQFIERQFPAMRSRFERLYARKYPPEAYRKEVQAMVALLQERHGLARRSRPADQARHSEQAPLPTPAQSTFIWSSER